MTVEPVSRLARERQAEMYRRAVRIMPGGADSNWPGPRPRWSGCAGLHAVMTERSVPHAFSGHPIMFDIVFAEAAPTDYRGWVDTDHDLYDEVVWQMILRGAMPEPDAREPWFLSESHAAGDTVDPVVGIFEVALDAALDARARTATAASAANRPTAGQATG